MIKVNVIKVNSKIKSIELKGHANSANEGEDLVCAGASTCFSGSINALEEKDNFDFKYEKGNGLISAINETSEHDNIVLEVLLNQLIYLSNYYPKNLKIKFN